MIAAAVDTVASASSAWLRADLAREIAARLPAETAGCAADVVRIVDELAAQASGASSSTRRRGRALPTGVTVDPSPSTWLTGDSAPPTSWTRRPDCCVGPGPTSAAQRWPPTTMRSRWPPGPSPAISAWCWSLGRPAQARRPCWRPPSPTSPGSGELSWVWRHRAKQRTYLAGRLACRPPPWPSCFMSTAAPPVPGRSGDCGRGPRSSLTRPAWRRPTTSLDWSRWPTSTVGGWSASGTRPNCRGGPRRNIRPLVRNRSDLRPRGGPSLQGGPASESQPAAATG